MALEVYLYVLKSVLKLTAEVQPILFLSVNILLNAYSYERESFILESILVGSVLFLAPGDLLGNGESLDSQLFTMERKRVYTFKRIHPAFFFSFFVFVFEYKNI